MTIITTLHALIPAEGFAVRGALTELDGRLYGLAGECGPLGVLNCNSTASWQTVDHTKRCPGSLFSLKLDGSDFRVDHAFSTLDDRRTNADGYHPCGTLAAGPDGRLYGVATLGGSPPSQGTELIPGYGVLFLLEPPSGLFRTLHTFFSEPRAADGEYPMGALAIDPSSGCVYGTCKSGGETSTGTVWEWSPGGAFRYSALPGETYGGVCLSGGLLHGATFL